MNVSDTPTKLWRATRVIGKLECHVHCEAAEGVARVGPGQAPSPATLAHPSEQHTGLSLAHENVVAEAETAQCNNTPELSQMKAGFT